MSEKKLKMIEEFRNEARYLKRLEKKLEAVEGDDVAIRTYYEEFQPSDLTRFLRVFLETWEEQ